MRLPVVDLEEVFEAFVDPVAHGATVTLSAPLDLFFSALAGAKAHVFFAFRFCHGETYQ